MAHVKELGNRRNAQHVTQCDIRATQSFVMSGCIIIIPLSLSHPDSLPLILICFFCDKSDGTACNFNLCGELGRG